MACDPWTLAVELPCYRCFSEAMADAVTVELLEEITESGPVGQNIRITDDLTQRITDDGQVRLVMP